MFSILKLVSGGATSLIDGWFKGKEAKQQRAHEQIRAGIDERANGWKDEYALLIVTLPFIAAFWPDAGPHIEAGFDVLREKTPDWYQYVLVGGLCQAMGISMFKKLKK